jgi:hypothetical protein
MFTKTWDIPFCNGSIQVNCKKKDLTGLRDLLLNIEYNGKEYYQLVKDRGIFLPDEELNDNIIILLDNRKIGFTYGIKGKETEE